MTRHRIEWMDCIGPSCSDSETIFVCWSTMRRWPRSRSNAIVCNNCANEWWQQIRDDISYWRMRTDMDWCRNCSSPAIGPVVSQFGGIPLRPGSFRDFLWNEIANLWFKCHPLCGWLVACLPACHRSITHRTWCERISNRAVAMTARTI